MLLHMAFANALPYIGYFLRWPRLRVLGNTPCDLGPVLLRKAGRYRALDGQGTSEAHRLSLELATCVLYKQWYTIIYNHIRWGWLSPDQKATNTVRGLMQVTSPENGGTKASPIPRRQRRRKGRRQRERQINDIRVLHPALFALFSFLPLIDLAWLNRAKTLCNVFNTSSSKSASNTSPFHPKLSQDPANDNMFNASRVKKQKIL